MNNEMNKFKAKRNFLGFVTSLKGKIRLNQKTAYIDSDAFTKSFDKVKLKFTVCEDGLEVEQIDSNQFSRDMIQRFVDEICDGEVIGYAEKFVMKSLNFYTDELDICYLEVDHQKPIDRLFSIFDDIENDKLVSEKGMSILDELIGSYNDDSSNSKEEEEDVEVEVNKTKTKESTPMTYMEESFKKMREEKILDLKSKSDSKLKEIKLIELDINNSQSKLQNCIEELNILNSRIESFNEKDPELGIVFNVSQENKSGINPDETLVNVIEKISPILKLNKNVLIDILTKGYYTIKFAEKDNFNSDFEIGVENLKKVTSIDPLGKFTIESPHEIRYYGDMTWHKIVNILINKGFEQSPEFDKICESNSYKSEISLD